MKPIFRNALYACVLLPLPAAAETVSFEAGVFSGIVVNADATGATGLWQENGFDVAWSYVADYIADDFAGPDWAGSPRLFDCSFGCGADTLELRFTRPDSRPFDLNKVDLLGVISGYLTRVEFFDGLNEINSEIANFSWDNVKLNGSWFSGFGGAIRNLGSAFQGLTELTVRIGGAPDETDRTRPDNAAKIDTILAEFAANCTSSCPDPALGAGDLNYTIEGGFFTNYGSAVTFDSFDFTVTGSAVAPVPLPAGLPLMLTGIGAVLLARGRLTRR